MMDSPLLVPTILRHAALYHGGTEVVSRSAEGDIHRTTYAGLWQRSQQLANALAALGLDPGDRVATLAWNGYRHVEIYYASAGAGFVCHTINPRLFSQQIAYIIRHAADRALFIEPGFLDLLTSIAAQLPALRAVVVMCDAAAMPAAARDSGYVCYEDLLAAQPAQFDWPQLDEDAAGSMCYTSGTTGDPKGVLYSHRSMVLHAMAVCLPDVFALGASSVVMPVVPMFHVNAWGLPHAAPLVGAKLVLPGPKLDGASLHELITAEGVTFTAGVPTVWTPLLDWADQHGLDFGALQRVAIGGSACPPVMFRRFRDHAVAAVHAWGMTETSPIGLANWPKVASAQLPDAAVAFSAKQGRPLYGMEFRIVRPTGEDVPHDGVAFGNMQVRGPWVSASYHDAAADRGSQASGWFETGDVATMDADGFVQIVDRTKDVIKSGGEWISSIDLENIAVSHPAVQEAAVVAQPDPRWGERPLLVVVLRAGASLSERDLLAHYAGKVARWWVPDRVVFAGDLPHTATGKLLKSRIRELHSAAPGEQGSPKL